MAAQIAILAAIAFAPGAPVRWHSLAMALLAIAAAIFITALIAMGPALSPLPSPSRRGALVTNGLFGLVRHPIYSALMLGMAAFAQITHSWPRAILTVGLILFLNKKAIYEERLLSARYPEYEQYSAVTKRFVPWLY